VLHNSARVAGGHPAAAAGTAGSDDAALPTVPEMMGSTFEGFGTLALKVSSEADDFAAEVHRLQQDETDRMARMKAELEQALKDDIATESGLEAKNKRLDADIQAMRAAIKRLRQQEKQLRGRLSAAAQAFARVQGSSTAGAQSLGNGRGGHHRSTAAPHRKAEAPADTEGNPKDAAGAGAARPPESRGDSAAVLAQLSDMHATAGEAAVSHVTTEGAVQGDEMLGRMQGLAAGLGQMLYLERRAEARYEAIYTQRLAARQHRIAKLRGRSKGLQSKLNALKRKHDKLVASVARLQEIYRGLAQAPAELEEPESDA